VIPSYQLLLQNYNLTTSDAAVYAAELALASLGRIGLEGREVGRCRGAQLEGLKLEHPWLPKQVPVILGDHVTLEAGTGAVHTAPAHGQEDFAIGRTYELPVVNPVGPDGRFAPGTELVAGLKVDAANPVIVAALEERGRLLHQQPHQHSYPHCWRHKTPLIFRATSQWFISMDARGLRAGTLRDIRNVHWTPEWGQPRITGMIDNRPDWCLSRQRTWGVPITLFTRRGSGELHPRTAELIGALFCLVSRDVAPKIDAQQIFGFIKSSFKHCSFYRSVSQKLRNILGAESPSSLPGIPFTARLPSSLKIWIS